MGYRILEFQQTPNPNAVKCVLDTPIADRMYSYRSASQAAEDPLAQAVFALPGVVSLLISRDWLTVNKHPSAPWPPLKKGLSRLLSTYTALQADSSPAHPSAPIDAPP